MKSAIANLPSRTTTRTLHRILFLLLAFCFFVSASAQPSLQVVNKGRSGYSIYFSPSAPPSVREAAADLAAYIRKQTGATLPVVAATIAPKGPFISLGETDAAKASGLNYEGLKGDGFKIITKGKNIFIFGNDTPEGGQNELAGTETGTANGVYAFLENFAGIRWLMPGEKGEYIPAATSLVVPSTNLLDNPGLLLRNVPYLGLGEAPLRWEKRIRLGKAAAPEYNHSWEQTIPASLYDKHPDYFAKIDGKHQPPGERHKLETVNPALVQAYADVIIKKFSEDPNRKWYSLSPSDGLNGEQGWSNSPETVALYETDPRGRLSKTPLILKFYNDVARIVKQRFPDRKLGGYIYEHYFYPPNNGVPALEPNLGFMVAASPAYGFQLYRASTQKDWLYVIDTWGAAAKKTGTQLYYYDLPTALMQHNGIIQPPAPDILNFIFHRLGDYNFLGTRFYGRPVWPVFGAMNYAVAKMCWNPKLDAHQIQKEYYRMAYGNAAAPFIARLYAVIDSAYKVFYEKNPDRNYNLTPAHMRDVYAPIYPQLEEQMLAALRAMPTDSNQRYRLSQFGDVFRAMEWNMRSQNLFPAGQRNKIAITDAEMDRLVLENETKELPAIDDEFTPRIAAQPLKITVVKSSPHPTTTAVPLAVNSNQQLLLYSPEGGDVQVKVKRFNPVSEFIRYVVYNKAGQRLDAGAMREGRTINIKAQKGEHYYLDVVNRRATIQYEVTNALAAVKTNRTSDKGLRLPLENLQAAELPFYVYHDKESVPFGIIMSFGLGVKAKVYGPDGALAGELSTVGAQSSRYVSPKGKSAKGFWKIVVERPADYKNKVMSFTVDEGVPGWAQTGENGLMEINR